MTTINAGNLTKLADGLAQLPEAAPFDMAEFRRTRLGLKRVAEQVLIGVSRCDTAACALGWGPTISGLEAEVDDVLWRADGKCMFNWTRYSNRLFVSSRFSQPWRWCFASEWEGIDNTRTGAIKRIRYLVDHDGHVPPWFSGPWICHGDRQLYSDALAGYSA